MKDDVRRRLNDFLEAAGVDMKKASIKAGFGDTYARDVVKRGRGKIENVETLVRSIDPAFVNWVLKGIGSSPTPATIRANAERPDGSFSRPATSAAPALQGFEEDGAPYSAEGSEAVGKDVIVCLLRGRQNAHAWTMKSDVLALKGIRAGDVLIIDQAVEPKNGDIVCAQIEEGLTAKTVFRVYQMPNIVAAGFDPSAVRPEIVDGERVRIAGVMTDLLRRRG